MSEGLTLVCFRVFLVRLFFEREHLKMPDNQGERRECLIILEKVGYA